MLNQMSLLDLLNATSSPVLASGATPCAAPVGLTTGPSGQDHALANLSARQAKAMGLMTSGTYGPHSTTSSASAALTRFLASRLQAKTALVGSTLYRLTWKERVTPSGRSIPALRASARPTSDNGFTGWPTPKSTDGPKGNRSAQGAWNEYLRGGQMDVPLVAQLAGWPTPTTRDHKDTGELSASMQRRDGKMRHDSIPRLASLCEPARLTASGEMLTGSSAAMENGGQLNPAHSRWLMGLPPEWDDCAVTAMQSLPRKRKHSSKP